MEAKIMQGANPCPHYSKLDYQQGRSAGYV